jgi:hypothetical protein
MAGLLQEETGIPMDEGTMKDEWSKEEWSKQEKTIAHRAYKTAYHRECAAILENVRVMSTKGDLREVRLSLLCYHLCFCPADVRRLAHQGRSGGHI